MKKVCILGSLALILVGLSCKKADDKLPLLLKKLAIDQNSQPLQGVVTRQIPVLSSAQFYCPWGPQSSMNIPANGAVRVDRATIYNQVTADLRGIQTLTANLDFLPEADPFDRIGRIVVVLGATTPTSSSNYMEVARFTTPFAAKEGAWNVFDNRLPVTVALANSELSMFVLRNSYNNTTTTDVVRVISGSQFIQNGKYGFSLAKKTYAFDLSYLLPLLNGKTFWVGVIMGGGYTSTSAASYACNLSLTTVSGTPPNGLTAFCGTAIAQSPSTNFNFSSTFYVPGIVTNPQFLIYANSYGYNPDGEEYLYRHYNVSLDGAVIGSFSSQQNGVGYLPFNPSTGAPSFFTPDGANYRNWIPAAPCVQQSILLPHEVTAANHTLEIVPVGAPSPGADPANHHDYSVFLVSASAGINSGSLYKIVSAVDSKSVLDVTSSGTGNGTAVQLFIDNGTLAQRWRVTKIGNSYSIVPQCATASNLDVMQSGALDGTPIDIYASNATKAQTWQISPAGNDTYTLTPDCSPGFTLDLPNSIPNAGTKIQLYRSNGSAAQKWILVPE